MAGDLVNFHARLSVQENKVGNLENDMESVQNDMRSLFETVNRWKGGMAGSIMVANTVTGAIIIAINIGLSHFFH